MATDSSPVAAHRTVWTILAVCGAAAFAWFAAGFASFTWQATVAVGVAGLAVLALGLRRRPPGGRRVHERPRGYWVWVMWALALTVWWGSAFLAGSRPAHPTLSLLLDPALELHPVRAVAFLGWLLAGWMLVRR